jgi:RNA polymerase sigma-70 factor (ECF subfamily)
LRKLLGRLAAEQYSREQPPVQAEDPAYARVLAAVGELRPAHREALLLVHWEQLTYAEAAEALGCSVNAVGIRVHKARARLRELLAADTAGGLPLSAAIEPDGARDGS